MPYIPDVIDKLQGCRFFTKLDMASGYWQVPIHPEDIHKTAFVTQDGHYEWLVLPFGLKNAPATFHRIVQRILGNLLNHGVYSYLDDVILYAKTQEEHDSLLREVFTRLKEHNVKLKRTKCMFSQSNVEFLGHIINNDQVRPIPSKVKSVLDFPDPKNVKELQQFLGLTGYFREYIPEYSTIAEPLTRLLRKGVGFEWGPVQQQAAQTLKQSLANDPVRVIFNPDSPIELHTDASAVGIGAILIQCGKAVGYFSRKLSDAETRYPVTQQELLAVHDAIKYFRIYLEGHHFKLVTDHEALKWLLKFNEKNRRLFNWSKYIDLYDYEVEHRPGRRMAHVDALSRAPVNLLKSDQQDDQQPTTSSVQPTHGSTRTPTITTNTDGTQQVKLRGKVLTVVPEANRLTILRDGHDNAGHPGIRKTQKQLSKAFWWPQMAHSIKLYVRSCHACQMVKPANHPFFGQLQPLETPSKPLDLISMDTVVMGASAKDTEAKYIQVVLDHNSRYVWAKATSSNSAQAAISLLEQIFNSMPSPAKRLLTDNYQSFRSQALKRFLNRHGCSHSYTSAYHPQTNGANEKVNDTILKGLRLSKQEHPRTQWSNLLRDAIRKYNNTIHDITDFTPAYLMFGRDQLNTSSPPQREAQLLAK